MTTDKLTIHLIIKFDRIIDVLNAWSTVWSTCYYSLLYGLLVITVYCMVLVIILYCMVYLLLQSSAWSTLLLQIHRIMQSNFYYIEL